ncbi:MAG: phospholipase D family protein [Oceanicaulis sp.]|nr:phospholipase D family protein [Oceanicaulis sp.]
MAQAIFENWSKVIAQEAAASEHGFDVVCPFVKSGAVATVFPDGAAQPRRLLTRLSPLDMLTGVHDIEALDRMIRHGVEVRGLRGLHAKVFLSRGRSVVVGSANLTSAALNRNHEYGVLLTDPKIVGETERWFDWLWAESGPSVSRSQIADIRTLIAGRKMPQPPSSLSRGLQDLGAVVGQSAGADGADGAVMDFPNSELFDEDAPQFLVKLLGTAGDRASLDETVLSCVESGGTHWSLHYPTNKRPRQVKAGAVAFVAQLVRNKQTGNDARIFGRVRVSEGHVDGRDDASPADIAYPRRDWKGKWPHYVRVHGGQFLNATLGEGVSVYDLIADMGPDVWQSHIRSQRIVDNPRLALQHAPHVLMSVEGFQEANCRLEAAFARHGMIPDRVMSELDWPEWAEGPA